jgi:DNA polymerase III subunit delta
VTEHLVVVVGKDATMVNDAVHAEIATLLGPVDPSLALVDLSASQAVAEDAPSVTQRALEALNTPPFLVDRRVVVVRDAQALGASDQAALLAWAQDPLGGITLVATVVGGRSASAWQNVGGRVVDVAVGTRQKDRVEFVQASFEHYGVRLPEAAAKLVTERLGEEMDRVDSLARTVRAVFGEVAVTFNEIEPYLGDAGSVPEWDLTDAIDAGSTANAIATLQRMVTASGRSGVQIINILQRHYLRLARLDGSGAKTGAEGAAIVGGHPYPAQKLVTTARALGSDRIARAVALVTAADGDLKGGVDFGGRGEEAVSVTDLTVTEVLVARLARLAEGARRA